jgi:hypothetical protein
VTQPHIFNIKSLTINLRQIALPAPQSILSEMLKARDLAAANVSAPRVDERYELMDNGLTILDHKTGLMWAANESEEKYEPDEAAKYCKALRLAGYDNWYQPDLHEQFSIVDPTRHNPCLPAPFKSHGELVWTRQQTPWTEGKAGSSRSFFCVYMGSGYVDYHSAGNRFRVRPVRVARPAGQ